MGLIISKEKSKYMIVYWKEHILGGIINNSNNNIEIGEYTFKCVDSFKHFRTLINSKTDMHCEIKKKVNNANQAYFSIVSLFKSKILSKNQMYNCT